MRIRSFGPLETPVPVIGQGTWEMERDPEASLEALRRGLDLGMTHIDTAEMYGSGAVEKIVARAIAGRRDEVFLVSKVLPNNASRRGVLEACDKSLRRLGTDDLDVYLLHWPSRHPLEETLAAFKELRQAGKIRNFGVSNFDARLLEKAISIAGPGEIVCNQVEYNLKDRAIEAELIPFARTIGSRWSATAPSARDISLRATRCCARSRASTGSRRARWPWRFSSGSRARS